VPGEESLPRAVQRLGEEGIGVLELSLHLPSLDEVFLTLTGRRAGDDDASTLGTTSPERKAA
jgi:oleandomycin transport system ATP-binding protein